MFNLRDVKAHFFMCLDTDGREQFLWELTAIRVKLYVQTSDTKNPWIAHIEATYEEIITNTRGEHVLGFGRGDEVRDAVAQAVYSASRQALWRTKHAHLEDVYIDDLAKVVHALTSPTLPSFTVDLRSYGSIREAMYKYKRKPGE